MRRGLGGGEEGVRRMCIVEDIRLQMRMNRLRWYGPIGRAGEDFFLDRVINLELEERGAGGRTKKTWRKCVNEDMEKSNVEKELVERRDEWKMAIKCLICYGKKDRKRNSKSNF